MNISFLLHATKLLQRSVQGKAQTNKQTNYKRSFHFYRFCPTTLAPTAAPLLTHFLSPLYHHPSQSVLLAKNKSHPPWHRFQVFIWEGANLNIHIGLVVQPPLYWMRRKCCRSLTTVSPRNGFYFSVSTPSANGYG